jgi:hypothetical protein
MYVPYYPFLGEPRMPTIFIVHLPYHSVLLRKLSKPLQYINSLLAGAISEMAWLKDKWLHYS